MEIDLIILYIGFEGFVLCLSVLSYYLLMIEKVSVMMMMIVIVINVLILNVRLLELEVIDIERCLL